MSVAGIKKPPAKAPSQRRAPAWAGASFKLPRMNTPLQDPPPALKPPAEAWALGAGGLLPFIAGAAGLWSLPLEWAGLAATALLTSRSNSLSSFCTLARTAASPICGRRFSDNDGISGPTPFRASLASKLGTCGVITSIPKQKQRQIWPLKPVFSFFSLQSSIFFQGNCPFLAQS